MKFLIATFFSLLFFALNAQVIVASPPISDGTPMRWRVGIAAHSDNGYTDPYLGQANFIIPRLKRANQLQVVADYMPFRKARAFRVSSEIGFYRVEAGNNDMRQLAANQWPNQLFYESIEMDYIHLGLGVLVEPFAETQFSPYLGLQAQIAVPTALDYNLYRLSSNRYGNFDQQTITGGEQTTVGWEVSTGLRGQLTPRWTASVGFYHAYLNFRANWPESSFRSFPNGIMRLDGGGVELRCQYVL